MQRPHFLVTGPSSALPLQDTGSAHKEQWSYTGGEKKAACQSFKENQVYKGNPFLLKIFFKQIVPTWNINYYIKYFRHRRQSTIVLTKGVFLHVVC